ncbi:hypothetical protein OHD50_10785 [Escherichia coli]|nr:hypothetical protein [Escherichia coli]
MVFSIIATVVGDFGGAERICSHLPPLLLGIAFRISATRRKRSAFATDVPPNFNTRMVVTSLPWSKAALSGAGFFSCFCTSARTVTCGNGDGWCTVVG